jgi:dTDP-4-dehydrorhamnose reductase
VLEKRMIDVLVIGGDGLIGAALGRELSRRGAHFAETSRRREKCGLPGVYFLDLETLVGLDDIPPARTVVLCAAETNLKRCAENPERSSAINVNAPARLADRVQSHGGRLLLLSTSAVLDGSIAKSPEDTPYSPMTVYGQQKALAERAVLHDGSNLVVRIGKVLHRQQTLLAGWKESLTSGQSIRPFSDLIVAPVGVHAVVDILMRLIDDQAAAGIYQFTSDRDATYADLAAQMARVLNVQASSVQPMTIEEAGILLEHSPLHATLSDKRLQAATGVGAPAWESAMAEIFTAEELGQ